MDMYEAAEKLRNQAALLNEAADYIAMNCQDDEDIDIDDIMRQIAEEKQERFEQLEERSLVNAYQQDVIDMYRYER